MIVSLLRFVAGCSDDVDYGAIGEFANPTQPSQATAFCMGLEYCLDFLWADLSAVVVEGIKGLCKGAFTTRTLASLTAFASSIVLVGFRVVAEGAFQLALLPFLCFYLTFPHFL